MCPEIFEVVIIGNNSFNNLADANTAILIIWQKNLILNLNAF
jgi:hypothetical protein